MFLEIEILGNNINYVVSSLNFSNDWINEKDNVFL